MAASDRLRLAIAHTHRVIEATPLATALATGSLSRHAYGALASQMWHLHRLLEPIFDAAGCEWPALAALWQPSRKRLGVLDADLRVLGMIPRPAVSSVIAEVAGDIAAGAATRPWSVVGAIYVLEGSRLGSTIVGRALADGWGVTLSPGAGLDYHLPPPAGWWKATVQALDGLPLDAYALTDACEVATALMGGLLTLYTVSMPEVAGQAQAAVAVGR